MLADEDFEPFVATALGARWQQQGPTLRALDLLAELSRYWPLDLGFYADIPAPPQVFGPPHGELVEEPPFIVPRPRPRASASHRGPIRLLLKAPVAAYQLPFLRASFPRARFQVVHLVRNPAASINGLIDGWLHWGFFSADVAALGRELAIDGYTTEASFTKRYWKFDLPPGWQRYTERPLREVCAFQWRSAHEHILDFTRQHGDVECHQLRFEELIQGHTARQQALGEVARFLGIRGIEAGSGQMPSDVVMATQPPRPGRWKARWDWITPLVTRGACADLASAMGYDPLRLTEWP
jgi:hypothetical protein